MYLSQTYDQRLQPWDIEADPPAVRRMKFNLEFGVDPWIIIQTLSLGVNRIVGNVLCENPRPRRGKIFACIWKMGEKNIDDFFWMQYKIPSFERYVLWKFDIAPWKFTIPKGSSNLHWIQGGNC